MQGPARGLASEAPLQGGKGFWGWGLGLPDQDLPIEHRSLRQGLSEADQLRKGLIDQVLAAAPETATATAVDQLTADAVPLPLQLPLVRRGLLDLLEFDWAGEEKRIGPRRQGIAITRGCGQRGEALSRGCEPAHQAMRDEGFIEIGAAGDTAGHQPGRYPDAETTTEQLVDQQELAVGQGLPAANHRGLLLLPAILNMQNSIVSDNSLSPEDKAIAIQKTNEQHQKLKVSRNNYIDNPQDPQAYENYLTDVVDQINFLTGEADSPLKKGRQYDTRLTYSDKNNIDNDTSNGIMSLLSLDTASVSGGKDAFSPGFQKVPLTPKSKELIQSLKNKMISSYVNTTGFSENEITNPDSLTKTKRKKIEPLINALENIDRGLAS